MPLTRSTTGTGTGTGTSSARSESHVEEEEDHWHKRMEQRLSAQEELIRDLYGIVGSLSKLKLLPKLFQDGESSSRVCDDDHDHDHEQAQEHSLPVTQEVQSRRSGELKKTAEDLDDFLGKVRTGGSVVNDEILGLAKLFNDLLTRDNISRIKNDDKMIQSEGGVDAFSEDELGENCRERGMLGLRSVEEMRQQQHYFKMEVDVEHQSSDPFNNIPSSIIEHILCLVPIKDAVSTSILSRNWRYHWTKIPKLVFDLEDMVYEDELEEQLFGDWSSETKELMLRCKQFFAIHQVLCMHRGPILEFSFSMVEPDDDTCTEIERIILHLARTNNNVKKFTLAVTSKVDGDSSDFELPRSIFLLRNLTDLHIENCMLDVVPTLARFGSLTSLFFRNGGFSGKPLLHLLAICPLLKKLELLLEPNYDCTSINIVELFKCLPVIEEFSICQFIVENSHVPPELPVALVNLKRFRFSDMWFLDTFGLQFLILVMRSSPNLEKIELEISEFDYDQLKGNDLRSHALKDCPDMKHLKTLEIRGFANMKHDLKFVKLILEKAPVLKKVRIFLSEDMDRDEELKVKRNVLRYPRVSPLAEISVRGFYGQILKKLNGK